MRDIRTVAVIGAGLIGASWAAWLAARGFQIVVFDPDPKAPDRVNETIARAWPDLQAIGVVKAKAPTVPQFASSLAEAGAAADFILEVGPERIDWKRDTVAQLDKAALEHVVIATCTSSLMVSDIQRDMTHPGRMIAAHPFNPPHLLPLVEIAGGEKTDVEPLDWAMEFFRAEGKTPVRVRKEAPGFIANRMASALYREAVDLVLSGVATVADVDAALGAGPGLRWAVMGPHLLYHLGAAGGYRDYLNHLGPAQVARWASLKTPVLDEKAREILIEGVQEETGDTPFETLAAQRDAGLIAVLSALAKVKSR